MGDGKSWETAYWLVYINQNLANSLEKIQVNSYVEPVNPMEQKVQEGNYYAMLVPKQVTDQVHAENIQLAKEIQEVKDQKVVNELRQEVCRRFKEATKDFDIYDTQIKSVAVAQQQVEKIKTVLKGGFPAFLWFFAAHLNGRNLLKRLIFEKSYLAIAKDKQIPQSLSDL